MPARLSNLTTPLEVAPGETASATVEVRNTGTIVDHFSCALEGEPAAWTTVRPATLNLLPGASAAIELEFRPPRVSAVRAGPTPFRLSVTSKEDPGGAATAEGSIDVAPFQETEAKLTPKTAVGWRAGRFRVLLHNRGNVDAEVRLAAADADESLRFTVRPDSVTIPPAGSTVSQLVARARNRLILGRPRALPFNVTVGTGAQEPAGVDGTLLQKPLLPRWVLALVGLVAAAVAFLSQTDALAGLGVVVLVVMVIGLLILIVLVLALVGAARNAFGRNEGPAE